MTTPVQTLAQGQTLASQYAKLGGFSNKVMYPPASKCFGAIIAFSGRGKSHLCQSHPNALVFNMDLSSTSNPNPRAMITPGLDSSGNPCEMASSGDAGAYTDPNLGLIKPVSLSWDWMLEKKKLLLEMAKNREPRPDTIFLDTVAGSMRPVQDWVTRNSVTLGISREPKDSFGLLHGPSGWDEVYNQILNFGLELKQAGYGFYYVIHLAEKMVKREGEDEAKRTLGFNITETFWLRLFPWFEIVMEVDIRNVLENVVVPGKTLPGGKKMPDTTTPKTSKKRVLVVESVEQNRMNNIKQRLQMPAEIFLPERDEWDVFDKHYSEAVKKAMT